MTDLVSAFIEAACVPRSASHASGTLAEAERILAAAPHVARTSVHTAAILGDAETVAALLAADRSAATATGGPHGWDALTHLCFSRYLRLDRARADAFVRTARLLLDAGASARTGFYETIDHPKPRPLFESAIYGAAGVARQPALTQLLLERGADPNDEETPYHVPETDDNSVLQVMLDSGALNADSLAVMLLRKADWHDLDGLRRLLDAGADPTRITCFGYDALHQAIRRDNAIEAIALLLERGADPAMPTAREGLTPATLAARRGRGDVLRLLDARGALGGLRGVYRLLAACALDDQAAIRTLRNEAPSDVATLVLHGGTLLAQFAGNGNASGVRHLLACGVSPTARYEGDAYMGIAPNSTALHVAAWRARPEVVRELIAHGAPVDATDGRGRTALSLAVKACVDSYWTSRRSPDSVAALLAAGASTAGIETPCGYDEVDALLAAARRQREGPGRP
jgi:ankyrin repeat protein